MSLPTVRLFVFMLLGGLVLLIPADGLRALGLGEARVDSYLGQPLDVTIRLIDVEIDDLEAVTIAPASPADFERLGVPSGALGLGLDISLDRQSEPPSIRVRSNQAADDPVVQILIDARFGSGRMLREYTLFLDPPAVDAPPPARREPEVAAAEEEVAPPEPEPSPEPGPAAPAPEPEPAAPAPEPESRPADEPEPAPLADDTVRVERGDTLWRIGQAWRPDPEMSMDQVMLAIFERNRHAFMDENINRLRADVELTMPDADAVRGLDPQEAERHIREQMLAWQQTPTEDVAQVSDAGVPEREDVDTPVPATEDPVAEEEPEVVHRLDVVPPEEEESAEGPVVSEGDIRRVQSAVSEVEDEILADRLESEEFDERIAQIREALAMRDAAGLAVAEEELAELEARLREARRERAETEDDDEVSAYFDELERDLVGVEEDDEAVDQPVPDAEVAQADADETAEAEVAESAEEAAVADAEDSEAAPMPTTPTGGSGQPVWFWTAIGGGVILLGLVALAFRRRRSAESVAGGAAAVSGVDDPVETAREAVVADPANLAAHVGLLRELSDRDDARGFSRALDEMYRQVEDEHDEHWREALGLARRSAPDHPLLTPTETSEAAGDSSEDLERRADQLMDMLDAGAEPEDEAETAAGDDDIAGAVEKDEELPDLAPAEIDEAGEKVPDAQSASEESGDDLGEDLDLAELSDRLDEPARDSGDLDLDDDAPEEFDLGEFTLDEDDGAPESADHSEEDQPEVPEPAGELDLDFEFSSSKDAGDAGLAEEADGEAPAAESDQAAAGSRSQEDTAAAESVEGSDEDLTLDFDASSGQAEDDLGIDFDAPFDQPEDELGVDAEDTASSQEKADSVSGPEAGSAEDEVLPDIGQDDDDLAALAGGAESTAFDETGEDEPASDEPAGDEKAETPSDSDEAAEDAPGLSDEDAEVKLDLARAYLAVDLEDSAREILEEVVSGASADKQEEARKLLEDL